MTAKSIIDAAFAEVAAQGESLSQVYLQHLDDFRQHSIALLDDLAAGNVTPEEAQKAAQQERDAVVSTLVSAGYDAAHAAQVAAMNVALAVLKAALVAV